MIQNIKVGIYRTYEIHDLLKSDKKQKISNEGQLKSTTQFQY